MKLFSRNSYLFLSKINVMGILNITPDSFSDGGKYNKLSKALMHVENMVNSGADIIDVGGESTRPGANNVSVEEELERVIPAIELIKKNFDVWISVNTSKPELIYESFKAGVNIINDVRSLSEHGALEAAVFTDLPVCIMHQSKGLCYQWTYKNTISEINKYFYEYILRYEKAGIKKSNIILDPGFGFGKNSIHNYHILANLNKFHHFKLPLLVGISRKSMIGDLLKINPSNRLIGSITCAVIAALQNIQIIRVHDVQETLEAINIVNIIQNIKECNL
ncbi:dihydropteroate synthase [Candidatus Pantoea edessiphila]|uniref:Dihydropteroate synthase n=1 Tax=Candidatus Pantoea edessiphila TaxID=2044610 RepID=A0A2P5SY79_9GAMM|nr:dihydropteroate synthase [Candidatus Pantoea edessiphila]MBK4775642.1 dihydropteroate synthase [Pantoea sp. Edef]PPI87288.1 dihydropteroate synthase [Candidatus Pantoea edessiphila]